MSFDDLETSNFSGKPIVLYEFARGTQRWRYCTADRDITLGTDLYSALPVSDGGMTESGDNSTESFDVTLPASATLPGLFRFTAPADRVSLIVRRMHYGDTEAAVFWTGSVVQVSRPDEITAIVRCQSLISALKSNGLRLTWQRNCPHMLYDNQCRVDRTPFATPVTVVALDGVHVQVSMGVSLPEGWFNGGYVEWQVEPGAYDRRMIEEHAGSLFRLLGSTSGLSVGPGVVAYPGCNRTLADCNDKFNNLPNYGGIPHLPDRSPFDGKVVF